MKVKAVIFDISGTLAYCRPEYRQQVVGKAFSRLKLDYRDEDIEKFWYGQARSTFIKERFAIDPEDFWKVFRVLDDPEVRKQYTSPYDDVGVIERIRDMGIHVGVVTGSPPHIAEIEIGCIGRQYFDHIICANRLTGLPRKPDPTALHMCAEALGVEPSEAMYVGNGDEDVLGARNAGMVDVHIDRKEYGFDGVVPTYTIYGLNELLELIR